MNKKIQKTIAFLLVLCTYGIGLAQQITVTGVVTSAADQSLLPTVNVLVKGKNRGVLTDFDGNYTIKVAPTDVLEFSYIGFETKSIAVEGKNEINVSLQIGVDQLEEVVVTGYDKIDRKKFTGVATRLKIEDVKIEGVSDPARLLEGRDAGVVVDNVSGSFGASPRIRIRGNTSLNGNNNPIFVVDGVILEDNVEFNQGALASGDISSLIGSSIAGLNPDDIASFDILKDASATGIYGARAKNGVIVITTKKGKEGNLSVNYNSSYAFRLRPRYENFNLLNSQQELTVYAELADKGLVDITSSQRAESFGVLGRYFFLRGLNEVPTGPNGSFNESFFTRYQAANTDWFKELFNDFSLQQTHSFSISGGSKNASYYFSTSLLNDDGQTIGNSVDRYTTRLNTRFQLSKRLSLGTSLALSLRDQTVPGTNDRKQNVLTGEFQREFDINPYSFALTSSRSVTPRDAEGNLEFFRKNYAPFNIIDELDKNKINIDIVDITFQTDLNYKFSENLDFSSTFNFRRGITQREHVIGDSSNQAEAFRADSGVIADINPYLFQDPNDLTRPPYTILPEGGINIYNENNLNYLYLRNSVTWSPKINDDNTFNVLLGQEIKSTKRENREYTGRGIIYDEGYVVNTDPDAIRQIITERDQYFDISNFNDRFVGVFLNAGYSFRSKYSFNGTLRYDGSNQQGSSSSARYLTSYNVSGAWNIHKEDFLNIDWINQLKLKTTYGLTGGRGPNTSASLNLRGTVPLRPQDLEGLIRIAGLTNRNLTFEKLKEFSVGLEYSVLNDRIAGEFGYYRRNSFDLIGEVLTSGVGGSRVSETGTDGNGLKQGNYADLKIEGLEFAIATVNVKTDNFKWSSSLNIGYNTEEVTDLDHKPRLVDLLSAQGSPFIGREISALYSTRFAGLNESGIPTFFDENNERVTDIDLQSRDNIEKILKYEGPTQPRGAGGFSNSFTYKNWSLSANISFKFDYKIRLESNFAPSYNDFTSLPGDLINRWRLPGDETRTNIPAIVENREVLRSLQAFVTRGGSVVGGDNAYDLYNLSSLRIVDGTYARLRSVSLGYALPTDYVDSLGLSSIKLRLQMENLALLYSNSGLRGQDPEFFNAGGAALPLAKTVTFALNVGF